MAVKDEHKVNTEFDFLSEFSNFYYPGISKCQKQQFPDFLESGTWKFQENENLKILSEKSNSVNKTKWKK